MWVGPNTPGLCRAEILPRTALGALSASSGKLPPKHTVFYLLCKMCSRYTAKDQQLFTAHHHIRRKAASSSEGSVRLRLHIPRDADTSANAALLFSFPAQRALMRRSKLERRNNPAWGEGLCFGSCISFFSFLAGSAPGSGSQRALQTAVLAQLKEREQTRKWAVRVWNDNVPENGTLS